MVNTGVRAAAIGGKGGPVGVILTRNSRHRAPRTSKLTAIFAEMDTHTSTNVHAEFRGQDALYIRDVRHNVHKRRFFSCEIFSFLAFKIRDVPRFQ